MQTPNTKSEDFRSGYSALPHWTDPKGLGSSTALVIAMCVITINDIADDVYEALLNRETPEAVASILFSVLSDSGRDIEYNRAAAAESLLDHLFGAVLSTNDIAVEHCTREAFEKTLACLRAKLAGQPWCATVQ